MLTRYHDVVDRRAWLVRGGVSLLFGLIAGVGRVGGVEPVDPVHPRRERSASTTPRSTPTSASTSSGCPSTRRSSQWLFASLIIILLITVVADYLNGGIRLQTPDPAGHPAGQGPPLGAAGAAGRWSRRSTTGWPALRAHLLDPGRRRTAPPTPTCKAQLPALNLLMFIALLSCGLFIYNIWRRGWVLPIVAVGLWALVALVAGTAYPAFVQRFQVLPDGVEQGSALHRATTSRPPARASG